MVCTHERTQQRAGKIATPLETRQKLMKQIKI